MQLPEVNDSSNFEEYGNRKYRIILFLRVQLPRVTDSLILQSAVTRSLDYPACLSRVQLPEVNDSSYVAECDNRK